MPYIKKQDRKEIDRGLAFVEAYSAGELNYIFTKIAHRYVTVHGESYQTYNDIMGALDCCSRELYRRKIAPYEDVKIKENGDL